MKTHQILFLLCLLSSPFSYIQAQALPMDQMIGTNSFVDAPMDKMEAVSFIREYHPWSFTEIEDDVFEYNRWNGFWDFDAYYTDLKQLGITVCPVLWSSPDWLEDNSENKPCDDEEDPEDPSSYTEMAQLMYQYAARYGNTVVDEEKLLVNTGQVKKSGMGVLTYYEDWNEQDRDWAGRDPKFLAEEYAAMASANVDGHGGTLGEGLGIKSADPSAKFVMGGLYILGTNYLSKMHKWFQENRPDQNWPIDVINLHHYAYTFAEHGICPEQDGYKAKVKEVIEWRDQYAPDNEVWITEFGYDTNETSQNRVDPFAGFTQQEIQAQWIVRTYLILSSVGVNRAAQFMIRDADPGSQPRWSDCGLTLSDSENYLPKTSWYYVYSLKNIMKGFYFDTVVQESPEAYVYRFVNESGDQYTYALWSPSGNGSTSQYQLEIPSEFKFRNKVQLTDGSIQGSITPIESSSNKLELELSETPVFLVADYSGPSSTREIGEAYPNLVFPNPFSETIQLRLPTLPGNPNTRIIILTPDGKQVRNLAIQHDDPNPTINLSDLKGGFYFLTARTGSKIYYKKIVKH